jgi:hypothetical protein
MTGQRGKHMNSSTSQGIRPDVRPGLHHTSLGWIGRCGLRHCLGHVTPINPPRWNCALHPKVEGFPYSQGARLQGVE